MKDIINLSRKATVEIQSVKGNSKGTGFFIGENYIATCFHVIGVAAAQGTNIQWATHPDIKIKIHSGEIYDATVISLPISNDIDVIKFDFAILKTKTPISQPHTVLDIRDSNKLEIGTETFFSGYPLATPGMVTHKGMISGFDPSLSVIFLQAAINKGNSGGALMDEDGKAIGIISMREGGISLGLQQLTEKIDAGSKHGSVQIMGVDPLQSVKDIVRTLDQYISTGIGYAHSIKFLSDYVKKHPLK